MGKKRNKNTTVLNTKVDSSCKKGRRRMNGHRPYVLYWICGGAYLTAASAALIIAETSVHSLLATASTAMPLPETSA